MKKFVLALLAVVLVLGLSAVAFADDCTEYHDAANCKPVEYKAPACRVAGKTAYKCVECDVWVIGNGSGKWITAASAEKAGQGSDVPALEHDFSHNNVIVKAVDCINDGYSYKVCANAGCDVIKIDESTRVKAKGEHTWAKKNDNETGSKECTTGYNVEYWCTVKGCGATKTEKVEGVAHAYNIFVEVVQKGDCTHNRIEKFACSCGATTNKTTYADGHNYKEVKGVGDICVENVIDTFVCLDCGDTQGEYQYEKVYNKAGQLCEIAPFGSDKAAKPEDVVNNKAAGHKWNPAAEHVVINAKTCLKDGLKQKECTVCHLKETYVDKTAGHTWGNWTVVAEPRCEEDGLKVAFCTVCSDAALNNIVRKTEIIPKLGHNVKVADETKAATCTEAGYTKGRCIVCEQPVTTTIDPLGHAYGEWTVKDGLRYKVCANCNDIVVETVAPVVPETPADPDQPATGDDDDNTSEGGSSSTGSGSDASIPATGDNTSNAPYIMMVAAVAGLVVLVASKRKVNC